MDEFVYEFHTFMDKELPIYFHYNYVESGGFIYTHWHENIEILCFIKGAAIVTIDTVAFSAKPGDIIIINANNIHSIIAENENAEYYCLIVDPNSLEWAGLNLQEIVFKNKVNNVSLKNKFMEILDEFSNKLPYYKTATKALISTFLVELCRKYVQLSPKTASKALNGKMEMVKMAVLYIKDHFKENIKIDDIAVFVGFSKYYLCREFKIITGGTIVEYINFLKCSSAKSLLASGKYTVTEVAELYGFENLSYFTKTYKKVIGKTPSQTKND